MNKIFIKNFLIFILITFFTIFIFYSQSDKLGQIISEANNFIYSDINKNGGIKNHIIKFRLDGENLLIDINNNSNEYSPIKNSFLKNDILNFFILPFSVLIGLLSILRSKKRPMIIILAIAIYLFYSEFRLFIQILDHCNRVPYQENGKILSVLYQPNMYAYIIQALDEILIQRSAIYTRYLMVAISAFLPYYYYEKNRVKKMFKLSNK